MEKIVKNFKKGDRVSHIKYPEKVAWFVQYVNEERTFSMITEEKEMLHPDKLTGEQKARYQITFTKNLKKKAKA